MLPWQRPEPGTPISLHGALESFDPGSFEGRVAVHLGLRDDRMVREALDRLPQRKSFERSRQIGDVAVKDVKVPLMVSFTYRLMPSVFTVAMGKGVMEQVLAAPQPAPEPLELASLAIYPQRLPNLDEILTMVAEGIGVGRRIAHRMAGRLARYEHGQIGLTLDGDTLVFSAGMALAGGR
jgi:hypothetical protein